MVGASEIRASANCEEQGVCGARESTPTQIMQILFSSRLRLPNQRESSSLSQRRRIKMIIQECVNVSFANFSYICNYV